MPVPSLMSHCLRPIVAAKIAVNAPTTATVSDATEESREQRSAARYQVNARGPIVAAWMSAETGVGPAIASGSQM